MNVALASSGSGVPVDVVGWPVILIALLVVCACVIVHYFILWDMISRLSRRSIPTVIAIGGTVLGLIMPT